MKISRFSVNLKPLKQLNIKALLQVADTKAGRSQTGICLEYKWTSSQGLDPACRAAFCQANSSACQPTTRQAKSSPSVSQVNWGCCWESKESKLEFDRQGFLLNQHYIQPTLFQGSSGSNTATTEKQKHRQDLTPTNAAKHQVKYLQPQSSNLKSWRQDTTDLGWVQKSL